MKDKFTVEWTGSYPNLCSGEWKITYEGKPVKLSKELAKDCMNTAGTYSSWHFEDWSEVFEDYSDGLEFDEWIAANPWVSAITKDKPEQMELYWKIQEKDWRHGSCGGCI